MKDERDKLVVEIREIVDHVQLANYYEDSGIGHFPTDDVQEALYRTCEAERQFESWCHDIVTAARQVATAENVQALMQLDAVLAHKVDMLRSALEGPELPIEPPKAGPYR